MTLLLGLPQALLTAGYIGILGRVMVCPGLQLLGSLGVNSIHPGGLIFPVKGFESVMSDHVYFPPYPLQT